MEKVRLEVLSLFPSPVREDGFTLLLSEAEGPRRLPILLGPIEAQAIALALEEGQMERPLTHDLFKEVLLQLDYIVQEVLITELRNDVFFSKLTLSDGLTPLTVDARPSDAIAMALRFGAALYIDEALLEETCLLIAPCKTADSLITTQPMSHFLTKPVEDYSLARLEELLQRVISYEAYEQAAVLRDEIKRRNAASSG